MYMEQKNDKNRKFFLGKKPYYILGSNFGPYHSDTYFNNAHKFFEGAKMFALGTNIRMTYFLTFQL